MLGKLFKKTFKPLSESQDSVKKSIDKQQDAMIKQLQANQRVITDNLNRNRIAIEEGFDSGAPRAKHACGAPWVNKSTIPENLVIT